MLDETSAHFQSGSIFCMLGEELTHIQSGS